uniref:IMS_C domain-containing protein n=1 Tax=Steinernema glaseri TaxID=37863 RepID=A0A1I8AA70_9BILA
MCDADRERKVKVERTIVTLIRLWESSQLRIVILWIDQSSKQSAKLVLLLKPHKRDCAKMHSHSTASIDNGDGGSRKGEEAQQMLSAVNKQFGFTFANEAVKVCIEP